MGDGNYYRDALRRCTELYHEHGDRYFQFYVNVSNLCASLKPGTSILIDDYCSPNRHEEFCDVAILYECEQDWNNGEGLVYLSADRQRVVRSSIPTPPLDFKSRAWISVPNEAIETETPDVL